MATIRTASRASKASAGCSATTASIASSSRAARRSGGVGDGRGKLAAQVERRFRGGWRRGVRGGRCRAAWGCRVPVGKPPQVGVNLARFNGKYNNDGIQSDCGAEPGHHDARRRPVALSDKKVCTQIKADARGTRGSAGTARRPWTRRLIFGPDRPELSSRQRRRPVVIRMHPRASAYICVWILPLRSCAAHV